MIKYLTRNQIDFVKYDNCMSKSINSRIYGFSWYLNAVCDDWSVLVLDDYDAVMPLPLRTKYGINYIYQAPWVQQLGVFLKNNLNPNLFEEFIKKIPRKFKLVDLMLNSANNFSCKYITTRNNFILSLENSTYKELQKSYSKGRKSSVKRAQKFELKLANVRSVNPIIELFKENKRIPKKSEEEHSTLRKLVYEGIKLDKIDIYEVLNQSGNLIGGAVFLKDMHRITYLFSALNNEGRKKQAMSFLINYVIKMHSEKFIVIDFEGSMIPEIASFYKSFGAKKEIYYHYKKYRL